ncbi:tryptophan-rich sensory protein [Patescibacteria group bacterium]|nr:tryptophan-rich sensory protein [Patescibacteria group bacterium]
MKKRNLLKLIISLVICQSIGGIGSMFTSASVKEWYPALAKPFFTPPNWLFAPVWIALFFLMGCALYLVWTNGEKSKNKKTALWIFGIQLGLNALWSVLFFGLRSPISGFVEIIILWLAILATIIYFFKISKTAGFLMIPYILWVSLAMILNFYIFVLN